MTLKDKIKDKETRRRIEFWLSLARTIFALIAATASIITASFILTQHFK